MQQILMLFVPYTYKENQTAEHFFHFQPLDPDNSSESSFKFANVQ